MACSLRFESEKGIVEIFVMFQRPSLIAIGGNNSAFFRLDARTRTRTGDLACFVASLTYSKQCMNCCGKMTLQVKVMQECVKLDLDLGGLS